MNQTTETRIKELIKMGEINRAQTEILANILAQSEDMSTLVDVAKMIEDEGYEPAIIEDAVIKLQNPRLCVKYARTVKRFDAVKLAQSLIASISKWGVMAVGAVCDFVHDQPNLRPSALRELTDGIIKTNDIAYYAAFVEASDKIRISTFVDAIVANEEMDAYDLLAFIDDVGKEKIRNWKGVISKVVAEGDDELMMNVLFDYVAHDWLYRNEMSKELIAFYKKGKNIEGLKALAARYKKDSTEVYTIGKEIAEILLEEGKIEQLRAFADENRAHNGGLAYHIDELIKNYESGDDGIHN